MRTINSLKDLRQAKRELAVRREVTKREFGKHLSEFRDDAGTYILKKVLLPIGAGAVAVYAIKYFFFDKKEEGEETSRPKAESQTNTVKEGKGKWLSYFNILLSIIKVYNSIAGKRASSQDNPISSDENGQSENTLSPKDFVKNYRHKMAEQEAFEETEL